MRGLAAVVVLALTGCAGLPYSPELTVLAGVSQAERGNEQSNEPRLTMMLLQRFGKHGAVGCVHASEPHHGEPFNDDQETTMDLCGVGGRWGGKAR